jgi:hypothetical protein
MMNIQVQQTMGNCVAYGQSKSYVEEQMRKIPTLQPIIPRTQIRNVLFLHFMREPVTLLMNFETLQKEYPEIDDRDQWLSQRKVGWFCC